MHLSVIIPVHNEEKRLPKTLASIDAYLSKQNYDYEILVVDISSGIETQNVVLEEFPLVKLLKQNQTIFLF